MRLRAAPHATLVAAMTLASFVGACGAGGSNEEESPQPVVAARTEVVQAQPFTESLGAIGSVVPRAGHVASLGAPAQARISKVLVAFGEHVRAGQTLVQLEPTTFSASVQSSEAALTAAERNHERLQRLEREGIAPRKDVEQAAAELAKARADAVTSRRAAQLATIRSPIGGVVTRMNAALGAMADPAQPLVEIADPSAVDVVFNTTPGEAARVRAGASVALSASESAGAEVIGSGTVVDVGGTVDSASRSVAVRVRVLSPRRPLRIGENVFGRIAIATRANAVVVPIEALVPEGEGFKVFVVDSSGLAQSREVRVGGRTEKVAEIVEGLSAGERVVTYGAYGMDDSVKVVTPGAPASKDSEAKDGEK